MKVNGMVESAIKAINAAGALAAMDRGNQIDSALGASNKSFSVSKSMAEHIAQLPLLYGRKSVAELLGIGDDDGDSKSRRIVIPSINFGVKQHHIPDDLRMIGLDIKKKFHNAFLMQMIACFKSKMPVAFDSTPYFKDQLAPVLKAFSLTDFANWVPTLNTKFYFEEFELEPGIEKYFEQVTMQSRVERVPGAINRLKGALEADTATFSAQYNAQSNYTYTAQDCVCHTDITEDLMQDMVPQSGSFDRLRKEVALGVRRSKEDAIINGDDTITTTLQGDGHMDSDVAGGAATLFNKAFKGLRKIALAAGATHQVNNSGGPVDRDMFASMLVKMGKMAKEKGDLVWILGPAVCNRIVTGNVPELLTLDTFGPSATILTGNIPRVFGVEPYESEWVREDVNASGVYAGGQVLTTALLVKKSRFIVGQRAPMKIWATPTLASSDKMLLSCKERFSFAGVPQTVTNERSCVIAYNVSQS